MSSSPFDVVGIGNAIVDVIAQAPDRLLADLNLRKGAMILTDAATAEKIYQKMGPGLEASGGSVANTMAGLASLGSHSAYIGKVAADDLGKIFRHDMQSLGVHFDTSPCLSGTPTARSLILVTPDAQRTMNTHLGACVELAPDDIHSDVIRRAQVTYLEGYLWDPPLAKQAMLKAADVAHQAGRKVALSLSDSFCVDRHRAEFKGLLQNHVDVVFANESEILSLYQVNSLDEAIQQVRPHCDIAVITRSERGSLIVTAGTAEEIAAIPPTRLIDTTGAGDMYAAGFLYGYTRKWPLAQCGRVGALAAAEVISHYGPRPEVSLAKLVRQKMAAHG